MDARDSVALNIACCSFYCLAMAWLTLEGIKIIPESSSLGLLRRLFFSRTGLWFLTVVPAIFGLIAALWFVARLLLLQDIESARNIVSIESVIAIALGILAFRFGKWRTPTDKN